MRLNFLITLRFTTAIDKLMNNSKVKETKENKLDRCAKISA